MASVGRGRGRARALYQALSKVGGDPVSTVEKSLVLCLKNNSTANKSELLQQAQRLGTNEENITKLVHLLGEKCLEDLDLATNSGEVICSLIELPNLGTTFRTILLKRVQHFYTDRNEMRKMKITRYFGFATLLCSLFKWTRVNDEPLKALVVPIYGLLEELLNGQSNCPEEKEARENREQEIETFHNCLLMVASLLEANDKNRMTELFKKVREAIIRRGSPKMRCFLLELLESHVTGNWDNNNETMVYYSDLLMDNY